MTPLSWQDRAACGHAGFTLFFGPENERQGPKERRERQARAVCAGCPVRSECADDAFARNAKFGVWGGMGEEERKNERRRRLRAAQKEDAA